MKVIKRDGVICDFDNTKIKVAMQKALHASDEKMTLEQQRDFTNFISSLPSSLNIKNNDEITVEQIQDAVERWFMGHKLYATAKAYILYREKHNHIRDWVNTKIDFIEQYKEASNTANATIDDNSNASTKNVGVLNNESHKKDNINISRGIITDKLRKLFPDFDAKQYVRDLEHHIIYKHDESSFSNPTSYCVSITMYPFLTDGIKKLGGLSASPKNLDSFCGIFPNMIHAISGQFLGAVSSPEFLVYFTQYCKKEWGDDFYLRPDTMISQNTYRPMTISKQIDQYFQQIVYTLNQPIGARGLQSVFWNVSYFDKAFFEGMFGDFAFPDLSKPDWDSVSWMQKKFMLWLNAERLKTILTFPVESFALIYKDGKFVDQDSADFVAQEYARGHSFFTYISDTVDSLSSCCFSKDTKVLWKASTTGVHCTTLKELYDTPWEHYKQNLKIFHNGSWVRGKAIKLPCRDMLKVTTCNNKEFIMSDNHINLTWDGEKKTNALTTDDYLMFNTSVLNSIPEVDEHLTYEQGLLVGMFIGDGTFGNYVCKDGCVHDFRLSLNEQKWALAKDSLTKLANFSLGKIYNNVLPVHCYNDKDLVAFLMRWTNNKPNNTYAVNKSLNLDCLLQSVEFRKGILDGWYITDGGSDNRCYTISKELVDNMEILCTSLGLQTVINVSDRTDEPVIIRGQEFNRNYPLYCLRWYSEANHRCNKTRDKEWKKKNNSVYWKIKSIEPVEYTDDIYCIECNNHDEPYFTLPCGLITHNCRLRNVMTTREFNFTNGNMGVQTGSKSVITLNLSRIVQDYCKENNIKQLLSTYEKTHLTEYMNAILERVLRYHIAYNELLWEYKDAHLMTVYDAGFIDLDKQYLTIGINGLNQAAEFLGMQCNVNEEYKDFCKLIFSAITKFIDSHNGKYFGHQIILNCEQVPAESLAIKNYNWDKEDDYWVPEDTNLYASYIFKPNDPSLSVFDKLLMHSKEFAAEELSGGQAAHINLAEHLSEKQYKQILNYAGKIGCNYFTFNIPNSECDECGFITKTPITKCPKCGSERISYYDRVIGYLTKIANWSTGRQIEQKTRVYQYKKDI